MNVGGEKISTCCRHVDVMSMLYVSSDGQGYAHLSILGVISVVKVRGVGNKVECGVILEEGTCIQQRARMLWAQKMGLVGLNERVVEIGDSPARTS